MNLNQDLNFQINKFKRKNQNEQLITIKLSIVMQQYIHICHMSLLSSF